MGLCLMYIMPASAMEMATKPDTQELKKKLLDTIYDNNKWINRNLYSLNSELKDISKQIEGMHNTINKLREESKKIHDTKKELYALLGIEADSEFMCGKDCYGPLAIAKN